MSQAGTLGVGGSGRSTTVAVSTFQPNVVLQEFDDFIDGQDANTPGSKLNWHILSSDQFNTLKGTAANPGIYVVSTSPGSNLAMYLQGQDKSSAFAGPFALSGGTFTSSFIINLTALSSGGNTYRFSCGLADPTTIYGGSTGSDSFVNGVYFQYTNAVNGGNWTLNCTASSVTTTVNSSTATTTGFHTLTVKINAIASSASFYIDNTLLGTITTNIPTANITAFFTSINLSGTTPDVQTDLYYVNVDLTSPRPGPTFSQAVTGTGQLVEAYHQTAVSYQVLNTDAIIGCSAGSITITMPSSSLVTGQRWTVKDESGTAAVSNITISGNGKNIDGAASYVINTNYGAVDLYYSGSQFYLI